MNVVSARSILLRCAMAMVVILSAGNAQADIIEFNLGGSAGAGLLGGNISPDTGEQGTGGIGATGFTFNTVNNLLHVDLEWGSANGYSDLSQDVFLLHLHGPTAGTGSDAFGQVAPLMVVLSNANGFDPSASSGGINANFFLDTAQATALMENRTYINVHLSDSDTGRIRGYLTAVPEPGVVIPSIACLAGMVLRRRRARSVSV